MKDDEPVYIKNYRIPHSQKDEVEKQVNRCIILRKQINRCIILRKQMLNKEERYSRVFDYQIPVSQLNTIRYPLLSYWRYASSKARSEICKQQKEIEMRHLPAVDNFKRYGS